MLSRIAEHIPNQFISIEHYGVFEEDVEITEDPQVEQWAGGLENYTFKSSGDATTVLVEVDVTDDHIEFFDTSFPKALQMLKELAEDN